MSVTIKLRRGNSSEWSSNSSIVLASGEPGYEIDTGRFKIGDGSTAWSGLYYASVIPTGLLSGSGINIDLGTNGSAATISVTGLDSSFISDFNEAVDDRIGSGLFSAGTGINLNYDDAGNSFTVSVTGLISNPTNNRILTSRDNTTTGIDAESNLTFNGSTLGVIGNISTQRVFIEPTGTNAGNVSAIFAGHNGDQYFTLYQGSQSQSGYLAFGIHSSANSSPFNVSVNNLTGYSKTQTSDIVADTGNFDIIQFNTDNGLVDTQGQIGWNDTDGTVDVALTDTAIVHVGEHTLYRTRNTTGDVLYKGQAVYATGVHSNGIITPDLYAADGSIREIHFMGLVFEDVNNNNNGYVINFGHIYNIDTRGNVATDYAVGDETWKDGDVLYVHPTVAGKLTKVEPKHSISVAIILDAANNGKIFVRPTSYGHLDDNHDVDVSGVTNGQFLQYNSSTDYWVPSSSGNFTVLDVDNLRLDGNTLSATNTNGNVIVQTSGTGALQRDNGGNTRGSYAVDLQNVRSANTQVAAGNYSVIGGGSSNTASGNCSSIIGGICNTDSGYSNVHILGSNITATAANTTYTENLHVTCALKINKFDRSNLSVASSFADTDVLVAVIDPTGTASTESLQGSVLRSSLLNQPAQLQFRQGTDAERQAITPACGEPIWTTNCKEIYIGDGTTCGGLRMGPSMHKAGTSSGAINTVIGGNTSSGSYSTVSGGRNGTSSGYGSTLSGGSYNCATNQFSTVGGGINNTASSYYSTIGGGGGNVANNYYSTVNGGIYNSACGIAAIVAGGYGNTASGYYATIGGGQNNNASGSASIISGGFSNCAGGACSSINGGTSNCATGNYSIIAGGDNNRSCGTYSTVGGGRNNCADGTFSTVSGGFNNYACTSSAAIGGGVANRVEGNWATIGGGNTNCANGLYSSVIGGYYAKASRLGEVAHAAGRFAANGDAQHTILVARLETSDATSNLPLFLNGSQRLTIPIRTMWTFEVKLSAYSDTANEAAWWIIRGGIISNDGGDVALVGSPITENGADSSLSTASASVVADDDNDALEIRVTGVVGTDIRWVAVVDISQVSYGTP